MMDFLTSPELSSFIKSILIGYLFLKSWMLSCRIRDLEILNGPHPNDTLEASEDFRLERLKTRERLLMTNERWIASKRAKL